MAGIAISTAAAAMDIIRGTPTLDRTMYGSDQATSLEPAGLRR